MFIVEENGELLASNTSNGYTNFLEVPGDDYNKSIEYELIDGIIVHNALNQKAIEYYAFINKKESLRNLNVEYNGNVYQGSDISTSRISSNIMTMNDNDVINWKTKSNTIVVLTKQDLVNILTLINNERSRIITS